MSWYRKSAEQGYADAQCVLGFLYINGQQGVPQDYAEALKWLRKRLAGTSLTPPPPGASLRPSTLRRRSQSQAMNVDPIIPQSQSSFCSACIPFPRLGQELQRNLPTRHFPASTGEYYC